MIYVIPCLTCSNIKLVPTGLGLECYVCSGQFDNRDKCIKSSVQCRQNQDTLSLQAQDQTCSLICLMELRTVEPPKDKAPRTSNIAAAYSTLKTISFKSSISQASVQCGYLTRFAPARTASYVFLFHFFKSENKSQTHKRFKHLFIMKQTT